MFIFIVKCDLSSPYLIFRPQLQVRALGGDGGQAGSGGSGGKGGPGGDAGRAGRGGTTRLVLIDGSHVTLR